MNMNPSSISVAIGVFTATVPTFMLVGAVSYLFVVPLVLGIVCIILGLLSRRLGGRLGRQIGWIAAMLMLTSIVLPFGIIALDRDSGHAVVLIIPNGYRGPVRLIIDRDHGNDIPLKDGKYTYHVPKDGTLLIKDASPFRQWHAESAIYASGTPIPNEYDGSLPPDAVLRHSISSGVTWRSGKQEEIIEEFIGTKAELQRHLESR